MNAKEETDSSTVLKSALIVDHDATFLDSLRKDPDFEKLMPVLADRSSEAVTLLTTPGVSYSGVFLGDSLINPCTITLVQQAHQHHPVTPIFLLYKDPPPLSTVEMNRLAIHGLISKPVRLSELVARVLPPALGVKTEASDSVETQPDHSHNSDIEANKYIPVPIKAFLSGTPAFFEVFFRMPSGKFVKILNAKETIDPQRVLNYIAHGAKYLYIQKVPHTHCLMYCEFLAKHMLRNPGVSAELKSLYLAGVGNELVEHMTKQSPPQIHIESSIEFLGDLFELVQRKDAVQKDLVATYLSNAHAFEHAIAVSFGCALMSVPLGIKSAKIFKNMGLAGLLHDIGKSQLSKDLQHKEVDQMDRAELALYRTHPTLGASLLQLIEDIDPAVVQAVAEHHERRDGSGFPAKVKTGDINLLAEVVGIVDELVTLLRKKRKNPAFKVFQELEKRSFNAFSVPTIEAFRSAFLPGNQDF